MTMLRKGPCHEMVADPPISVALFRVRRKIVIIMDACDSIEKEEEPTEEGTSSPDLISCSVTASSQSDSEEDESSTMVTTVLQRGFY
jgi:hypothetical protein